MPDPRARGFLSEAEQVRSGDMMVMADLAASRNSTLSRPGRQALRLAGEAVEHPVEAQIGVEAAVPIRPAGTQFLEMLVLDGPGRIGPDQGHRLLRRASARQHPGAAGEDRWPPFAQ